MPGPVFLTGEAVDLHPIDEDDLPFLQRVINDPEVWPSLRRSAPVTAEDERTFYEENVHADNQQHLLIATDGVPVGIIGLVNIDRTWGNGVLGYFLDPAHHGQGYGTEAIGLLTDWAFDHRRLASIIAWVLPDNPASIRVLEKNGYAETGHVPGFAYVGGERRDILLYSRSRA